MLVKLVLIWAVFSFVYARSFDIPEIKPPLVNDKLSHDANVDHEASNIKEVLNHKNHEAPKEIPAPGEAETKHEHLEDSVMKKRESVSYVDDRLTDPRPGCCG